MADERADRLKRIAEADLGLPPGRLNDPVKLPDWLINNSRKPLAAFEKSTPKPIAPPAGKVAALMVEIVAVCERHGLWLAHEDGYGAFVVQRTTTRNWLMSASGAEYEVADQKMVSDRMELNDE